MAKQRNEKAKKLLKRRARFSKKNMSNEIIKFNCSNCNQHFKIPIAHASKRGKCPKCKTIITIPKSNNNSFNSKQLAKVENEETIKFNCTQCKADMSAPKSKVGTKIACHNCNNKRKVPKTTSKSCLATERQKDFARNVGIQFDADISRKELTAKLNEFQETKYFVMDVWKKITGLKLRESEICESIVNKTINTLLSDKSLTKEIIAFREKQYEDACEQNNKAELDYYEKNGPEPLSFRAYFCSVQECKSFDQVASFILKEWSEYKPKSFFKKLFGK